MPEEDSLANRLGRAYMKVYPTVRNKRVPWTPLDRPIAEARVALVTSCGVHLNIDLPFDLSQRRGDASFREIPATAMPAELTITHGHYDETSARRDLNCVFPLWRLQDLASEGIIGSVAPRHYGFRGSIARVGPLMRESGPEVARRLKADAVDVVLLTPC